jgi:hypothetical protein
MRRPANCSPCIRPAGCSTRSFNDTGEAEGRQLGLRTGLKGRLWGARGVPGANAIQCLVHGLAAQKQHGEAVTTDEVVTHIVDGPLLAASRGIAVGRTDQAQSAGKVFTSITALSVSTQVSRRDPCDDRTLLFPLHEGKESMPRSILETPRNPAFSRDQNIAVPRRSHHDLQHLPFQTTLVPNALSSTTAGVGFTRAEYSRRAIVRSVGSGGKMRSGCGLRAVLVRSSSGYRPGGVPDCQVGRKQHGTAW